MIECSCENIWYKSRPKNKFRRFLVFLVVLTLVVGTVFYYKRCVSSQVFQICSDYSYAIATSAVNDAVLETFNEQSTYEDFITVSKNSLGEIEMLSTNTQKLNFISRNIVEYTDKELKNRLEQGVPVPILSFSGVGILSGYGRLVNMKIATVSSVSCDFLSEFKSAGINQTIHSVFVSVTVNVDLELPLERKTQTHQTKVLFCETVLVGKVPETYLNGGLLWNK